MGTLLSHNLAWYLSTRIWLCRFHEESHSDVQQFSWKLRWTFYSCFKNSSFEWFVFILWKSREVNLLHRQWEMKLLTEMSVTWFGVALLLRRGEIPHHDLNILLHICWDWIMSKDTLLSLRSKENASLKLTYSLSIVWKAVELISHFLLQPIINQSSFQSHLVNSVIKGL